MFAIALVKTYEEVRYRAVLRAPGLGCRDTLRDVSLEVLHEMSGVRSCIAGAKFCFGVRHCFWVWANDCSISEHTDRGGWPVGGAWERKRRLAKAEEESVWSDCICNHALNTD